MLTVYSLKPGFQRLLQPLVEVLAQNNTSPNTITVAAMLFSGLGGLSIAFFPHATWPLLLLSAILLLRMTLNAMDGQLARQCGRESRLGILLNEFGDVFSDCALYLPLSLVPGINSPGIILLCLLAVLSEFAGVLAELTTGVRSYSGPMGKSDRALVIGAMGLIAGLGVSPGLWSDALITAINLTLVVTVINRLKATPGD
jgi:CDP-diacylglycerol--glycerol-3-phosphate 3-phosphatidyltransferase